MKRYFYILFSLLSSNLFAQNEDFEGCKDHPLFNRMPNFFIVSCEIKEFDAISFPIESSFDENMKKETVEGKIFKYTYNLSEGATQPSALQIYRNYENAIKQINGIIIAKAYEPGNSFSFLCAKIAKGNNEIWIRIDAGEGARTEYDITIAEKEIMTQAIQANDILNAINKDGYIALNILFDTGKSTIKAESQQIIEQVYLMLMANPSLSVSIEGHTDNVGNPADNKTLSINRAKAVMDALILKGINKERLSYKGWGQEKPIANNSTEEGKAKNRRVEIVKK